MVERNWKDRVVSWKEEGLSRAEIVNKCKEIGQKVSKSRIDRLLRKIYVVKKPYSPSSIVDREKVVPIFKYVNDACLEESDKGVDDLVKEIEEKFREKLTPTVVRRIREVQGFNTGTLRYGHSVREANRPPRLAFCTHHLSEGTMFTRHAFTDESMVQTGRRGRFVYVRKGDTARRVKPRFKHPPQLMVWGGVSWEGPTPLAILRKGATVDGGVYQSILQATYLEWAERKFGGDVVLVQDNARCHTSESTRAFFQRTGIQTLAWPAESPDLNPVELAWALMKQWLRTNKKTANLTALEEGIREWWNTKLTKALCRKLILHVQNQMKKVVKAQGGPVYD